MFYMIYGKIASAEPGWIFAGVLRLFEGCGRNDRFDGYAKKRNWKGRSFAAVKKNRERILQNKKQN